MRRPIFFSALALVLSVTVAGTAAAKNGCYTRAEHQAEQAIRLHNELMVIGLTCQALMPEKELYITYKAFTNKHRPALSRWEKVLMASMSQSGFDAFRTRIANESAKQASIVTPSQFCPTHAGMIAEAMAVSPEELADYVARSTPMQVSHPLCGDEPTLAATQTALETKDSTAPVQ